MINNFVNDKIISLVENKIAKEESADDEFFQSLISEIIESKHLGNKIEKSSSFNGRNLGKYNYETKEIGYNLNENLKMNSIETYGEKHNIMSVLGALNTVVHETTHAYLREYPVDSSTANAIRETLEKQRNNLIELHFSVANEYQHILSLPKYNYRDREALYYSLYYLNENVNTMKKAYNDYYDWDIEERIATYNGLRAVFNIIDKLLKDKAYLREYFYAPYFFTKAYRESFKEEEKISISPSIEYLEKSGFYIADKFLKYILEREEFFNDVKKEYSVEERIVYGLPITKKEYSRITPKILSLLKK